MKRFYISIPLLLAAVLGAACSNFDETPPKPGANEAVVGLRADIVPRQQTRAEIDVDFENGLSGSWNEVDILGVIHKAPGSQDFSALGQFAFDPESRTFKGTLPSQTGEWHYRAFYPHNGTASVSGSKTTVTVPFSALRTQEGNRYNSEYDLLAADAILYPNAAPGMTPQGEALRFNLNRFTTILALRMQGGAASEKVASVMLTAEKPIASEQLTFELPTSAYDIAAVNPTLVAEGPSPAGGTVSIDSERITVTYKDGTAPSADLSETFFNVLPDENYGELVFTVCTDKGNTASVTVNRTTPMVANWVYTKIATGTFAKATPPTIEWLGHDLSQRYELADTGNEADIEVSVPGGIRKMEVEIIAPVLTESGLLELAGLAPTMELTAPATENMAEMLTQLGFPTPSQLLDQQYAFFQIGGLIDLLAMVCAEVTETAHSDFRFTVTDNAGQQTTVTLQYAKTIASAITPGAAYNDDANFWTNTATLACVVAPEDFQHTTVEYKRTDGTWQAAVKGTQNAEDGTFTATISSAYNADNTMISRHPPRPPIRIPARHRRHDEGFRHDRPHRRERRPHPKRRHGGLEYDDPGQQQKHRISECERQQLLDIGQQRTDHGPMHQERKHLDREYQRFLLCIPEAEPDLDRVDQDLRCRQPVHRLLRLHGFHIRMERRNGQLRFALRMDCTSHGATGQSQGDGRQHSDPGGEEERAVHLGHLPRTHLRMYLRPGHPNRQRIPDQGA